MNELRRVSIEDPGAIAFLETVVKSERKFSTQLLLDKLAQEGMIETVILPKDSEEAKSLLAEIMKNYSYK